MCHFVEVIFTFEKCDLSFRLDILSKPGQMPELAHLTGLLESTTYSREVSTLCAMPLNSEE